MAGDLLLTECLDALIDYRGKTPRKVTCSIPLITAKVIKAGRIEIPDEFIAEADYEPFADKMPRLSVQLGQQMEQSMKLDVAIRKNPGDWVMSSEWSIVRIEDIAEKIAMGPFGSNIKVETFVESGVPIISGAHLHSFRVKDGIFNFVTDEHAQRIKNSNVFRGDVIFTHAGNIGQVAYIPHDSQYERYVISQRQFYLRCDLNKADPIFISYFFHSNEGRHKLLTNASQAGVPSIARPSSYLKTIELSLPPLKEQDTIAHILGTLDDRIDNLSSNQRHFGSDGTGVI